MDIQIKTLRAGDPQWAVVKAIRYEVFVMEQKVDEREEYDEFEETSHHFLALADNRAAGTARWRKTDKGYKLERFAVVESFRKSGVGSALVKAVLEEVLPLRKSDELIYLHAQVQALPFYAKLGFEEFGEEFVEAEILHRKMKFEG